MRTWRSRSLPLSGGKGRNRGTTTRAHHSIRFPRADFLNFTNIRGRTGASYLRFPGGGPGPCREQGSGLPDRMEGCAVAPLAAQHGRGTRKSRREERIPPHAGRFPPKIGSMGPCGFMLGLRLGLRPHGPGPGNLQLPRWGQAVVKHLLGPLRGQARPATPSSILVTPRPSTYTQQQQNPPPPPHYWQLGQARGRPGPVVPPALSGPKGSAAGRARVRPPALGPFYYGSRSSAHCRTPLVYGPAVPPGRRGQKRDRPAVGGRGLPRPASRRWWYPTELRTANQPPFFAEGPRRGLGRGRRRPGTRWMIPALEAGGRVVILFVGGRRSPGDGLTPRGKGEEQGATPPGRSPGARKKKHQRACRQIIQWDGRPTGGIVLILRRRDRSASGVRVIPPAHPQRRRRRDTAIFPE